ncbi:hypothetical protein [Roseateles chitosanitabidus]|uniref:hypothetical protein n=1 Tax=Roseateles chitosanitabidus TaxID=65048 RepID=UPI00235490B4|nr:hypothetical protein [Roseateles chitosanitabidus]
MQAPTHIELARRQRAAERCKRVAQAVATLEGPEPQGWSMEEIRLRRMRHRGYRHLAAMASLEEQDLVEPSPFDIEDHAAWRSQQRSRAAAKAYLADRALAGDLLKEA